MINLRHLSLIRCVLSLVAILAIAVSCMSSGSSGGSAINVGGDWSGTWSSTANYNGMFSLHLVDRAGALSGDITVTGSPCLTQAPVTGQVSGYQVTLSAPGDMSLSATVQQANSNTMQGSYRALSGSCQGDTGTFRLTRQPTQPNGNTDAGGLIVGHGPTGNGGRDGSTGTVDASTGFAGNSGSAGLSGSGGSMGLAGNGAGGAAGAGGSSGTLVPQTIGGPCNTAADCEAGLICLSATDTRWYGGPSNGYCTVDCSADPSLCAPYLGALCVQGATVAEAFCMEGCTRGVVSVDKCHGRADSACTGLDAGVAACLPSCGSDAQCPQGRFCDALTGACGTAQPAGDPPGAACDPASMVNTCQGGCLDLGGGLGECSAFCTLGVDHPACGSDPAAPGAGAPVCLPLLADTDVYGDLGECAQRCDVQQDCSNPNLICDPFPDPQTQAAFGAQGLCVAPAPADAGVGDAG